MKNARTVVDLWIARIGTAFGWAWFLFWAGIAIAGILEMPNAKDSMDYAVPIIAVLLAAVHFLLIRAAKRTRSLVQDFRLYSGFLAGNKSIEALCAAVGQPRETVLRNLTDMCRRGYIKGHIDRGTDRVVLNGEPDRGTKAAAPEDLASPVRCPGCGAMNRAGEKCRYCGNPLEVRVRIGSEK